jgi:hypothetical protein
MEPDVKEEMDSNQNPTVFVDLDGTLIKQNYAPDTVPDVLIQEVYDGMLEWKKMGAVIVATTARSQKHVDCMVNALPCLKDLIDMFLYNLPVGPRILINDTVRTAEGYEYKAIAFNIERDTGIIL